MPQESDLQLVNASTPSTDSSVSTQSSSESQEPGFIASIILHVIRSLFEEGVKFYADIPRLNRHERTERVRDAISLMHLGLRSFALSDTKARRMLQEFLENAPQDHVRHMLSRIRLYEKDDNGNYVRKQPERNSEIARALDRRPWHGYSRLAGLMRTDNRAKRLLMSLATRRDTVIYAVSYVYEEIPDVFSEISRKLNRMNLDGKKVYLWVDKHQSIRCRSDGKWMLYGLDAYLVFPVIALGDDALWKSRTWTVIERTLARCRCGLVNMPNSRAAYQSLDEMFKTLSAMIARGDLIFTKTYWIQDKLDILKWASNGESFQHAFREGDSHFRETENTSIHYTYTSNTYETHQLEWDKIEEEYKTRLKDDLGFHICLDANETTGSANCEKTKTALQEYITLTDMGYTIVKRRRWNWCERFLKKNNDRISFLVSLIPVVFGLFGYGQIGLLVWVFCVWLFMGFRSLGGVDASSALAGPAEQMVILRAGILSCIGKWRSMVLAFDAYSGMLVFIISVIGCFSGKEKEVRLGLLSGLFVLVVLLTLFFSYSWLVIFLCSSIRFIMDDVIRVIEQIGTLFLAVFRDRIPVASAWKVVTSLKKLREYARRDREIRGVYNLLGINGTKEQGVRLIYCDDGKINVSIGSNCLCRYDVNRVDSRIEVEIDLRNSFKSSEKYEVVLNERHVDVWRKGLGGTDFEEARGDEGEERRGEWDGVIEEETLSSSSEDEGES